MISVGNFLVRQAFLGYRGNGLFADDAFMSFIFNFLRKSLVTQIVIGLIAGALAGRFFPEADFLHLFGTIFVDALKAVAPALVLFSVMSAAINATGLKMRKFRRIIGLYLFSTLIAAVTSVLICFLFPVKMHFLQAATHPVPGGMKEVATALLSNLLENPVNALRKANYISILIWAIIFGIAMRKHATAAGTHVIAQITEALTTIVRWIIRFAPFGIMGIFFTTVTQNGLSFFKDYNLLRMTLTGTMIFVALVVNPILVFCIMRRNPYPLVFKCLKDSGVTAFFTRSSAANIPVNIKLCEDLKLDKEIYSVSVPLGATINMDGAAVTVTVMTMAAAHTLGIDVTFSTALMMSVSAAFAACGTSGVAGGSIFLIPMACSLFGIGNDAAMQVVAVGFAIGVIQDSLETMLNSSGDVLFIAACELSDKNKKDRSPKA